MNKKLTLLGVVICIAMCSGKVTFKRSLVVSKEAPQEVTAEITNEAIKDVPNTLRDHLNENKTASSSIQSTRRSIKANDCISGQWVVSSADDSTMPAVRYESNYFAFRWSNNDASQDDAVAAGIELEIIWDQYINRIGFPEPYCYSATKYKANIHIDPTFGLTGGITSAGNMGIWIGPLSLKDNWGLAHEFTHALQGQTGGYQGSPYIDGINYMGWIWESHANWMAHQLDEFHGTSVHCSEMLVNYPHIYLGSTRNRYCNWQFMEYLKNSFGYSIINDMWSKAPKAGEPGQETADPLSVIKSNMGWSQDEMNDVMGAWAMHNVNWDYTDPDGHDQGPFYRSAYGGYGAVDPSDIWNSDRLLRTTTLDPISSTNSRRFAVPFAQAPQRWGYNIVRLIPDNNAASIDISFNGMVQTSPAVTVLPGLINDPPSILSPDSDWRWGIVAIDSTGKSRYSTLQKGASSTISFSLEAGDQGLYMVVMGTPLEMHKIKWDQAYYSIYRYPWMVDITNAWPEGYQPNAPQPTANGHRHSNGGGWVTDNAEVSQTAYVGPYARVIGGKVLDNARIEDHATILDGTVAGQAVVGGMTIVQGNTVLTDNAQAYTAFRGLGSFEEGNILSGIAQVRGDVEIRGVPVSHGVFYGFIDSLVVVDPTQGSNLEAAVPEVTATPNWQLFE